MSYDEIDHYLLGGNIEKAKRLLNWAPKTLLNEGIDMTINLQKGIECKQLI